MLITLSANTPKELLSYNPKRTKLTIQFQAYDVDNNNTGKIYIGYGFQPTATVGNANQGEVLLSGDGILEPSVGDALVDKYKRSVWAVSDTDNQTIIIEEEVESTPPQENEQS